MKDPFAIVNLRTSETGEPYDKPRPFQIIACRCGASARLSAHNGRAAPEHAAGTFRHRGWLVGDVGKHTCPACVKSRAETRRVRPDAGKQELSMGQPFPPSTPSSAAKREMIELLQVVYDPGKQNYTDGYTDARVAKEAGGLAADYVAKIREELFGPLKFDTLAADFLREWAAITTGAEKLQAQTTDLLNQASALRKHIAQLALLRDGIAKRIEAGAA